MQPKSNTGYTQDDQPPDGNENNPPQRPANNAPPSTIKNAFERNLAAFNTNKCPASCHKPSIASSTALALPSPIVPAFTPGVTNKAAQSVATQSFNDKCNMREPERQEEDPDKRLQELETKDQAEKALRSEGEKASKTEANNPPHSSSTGSVGSWTDDEKFISHYKKSS